MKLCEESEWVGDKFVKWNELDVDSDCIVYIVEFKF